ncbi:MAG: hypothetical protein DDT26_00228 [Dehalococcoidia bacterium]|nr:hypothetical protein [Chloroflexota bacterium]
MNELAERPKLPVGCYLRFSPGGYWNPIAIGVRWFTRSRFAHVDLVIYQNSDQVLLYGAYLNKGVNFQLASLRKLETDQGSAYVQVPVDLFCHIKPYHRRPYDLWGALATVFHWAHPWRSADRWFCSELVAIAMERANLVRFSAPYGVTPGDLFRACMILNLPYRSL